MNCSIFRPMVEYLQAFASSFKGQSMTYVTLEGKALEEYDRRWGMIDSFIFGITISIHAGTGLLVDFVLDKHVDAETFLKIFFLLIGIYLMVTPKKSLLKAIGLYSFAVALNKIPTILTFLTYSPSDTMFWLTGNYIPQMMFALGLVLIGFSINLCYSGYMYLTERCRGYVISLIGVSCMATVQTYLIFLMIQNGRGFEDYWTDYVADLTTVFMYVVYLAILLSDRVYRAEMNEYYRQKSNLMRVSTMAGYDAALLRSEAAVILEGPDSWERVYDGGPAEYEYRFTVSYIDTYAFGTVQKWKGDDELYFTLSGANHGYTFIEATRFSSARIFCDTGDISDCTKITFLSSEGDPVTFGVVDIRREVVT